MTTLYDTSKVKASHDAFGKNQIINRISLSIRRVQSVRFVLHTGLLLVVLAAGLWPGKVFAQTFNYGTGSIASNAAPFNTLGGTGITVSGNDITVTANVNMVSGTYNFANFTINAGVTVTVTGTGAPLIIKCTGAFVNNGILSVNGPNGATPANGTTATNPTPIVNGVAGGGNSGRGGGPSSNATGNRATVGSPFGTSTGGGRTPCNSATYTVPSWGGPGGGGGSYGTLGTSGTNGAGQGTGCTTGGGAGTAVYGDAALSTQAGAAAAFFSAGQTAAGDRWLLGGSGGAGGAGTQSILGSARAAGGSGGAGGGALQISANTIYCGPSAIIRARGGNGGNGNISSSSAAAGGGGGGGSGGTINLQYFSSYVNDNTNTITRVDVRGGIGGFGSFGTTGTGGDGGGGGQGRLLIEQDIVLCTAPTTQATNFSFSNVTTTSADITFDRGNGDGGVLVVARAGAAPQGPTGGTSYTANSVFGSGDVTAAGSYVVYNSNAAGPVTINVSGLTPGTSYQFSIHEWNTTATCYLSPGLTGTVPIPVCLPPSTQASSASVTPAVNSATISYTSGSGTGGELVVLRQGAAVSGDPVQTTSYTANAIYGSGSALGGGFVVNASTGGSVNITNLIENTTYHYAIYTFNTSGPCYTLPAVTGSFTTLNGPMSYVSSTNVQQTGNSTLGSTNQPVLRLEVVGGPGTLPALTVSSITFNTTGSANPSDLSGARIFYTGASTTFATTTQFGSNVNNPSGTHVVNGSQTLVPGVNYFWLVYDVSIGATTGNVIDGQITSLNTGSAQTPTITDPAGNRTITSLMSLSCGYSFSNFTASWSSNVGQPGTTVVASGAAAIDDQRWPSQSFATDFTFEFNGTVYSSFGIHSKGYIWFGATNPSGLSSTPISSATAYEGAISAFGFDMVAHTSSSTTPQVTVRYTGTAPNRVCIIEWTAFRPWNNTGGLCGLFGSPTDWNRYDIQLQLHENGGTNSNSIDIILRDMNGFCVNSNGASAQVGLRGATNSDFLNRSGSGNNGHTSSSAGTLNTSVISHGTNNFFNGNGGLRFTPTFQKPIISPSPTASNACPATDVLLSTTSPVSTKQWFLNNLPISGASGSSYTATSSGNYLMMVSQGGCSKLSTTTAVTIDLCGFPITAGAFGSGTISPSGVTTVAPGDDQTFTFTPDCGYRISTVLVDGLPVGTPTSYTFNDVDASHTISVTFVLRTELCNGIDDDCDGLVDEGCPPPLNENPATAFPTAIAGNIFPNCGLISGTLVPATHAVENVAFAGVDVWFKFIAISNAVSITMNGTGQDNAIALYNNAFALMPGNSTENAQGLGGSETLNYDQLTPGVEYFVSLGTVSGPGFGYTFCLRHLTASFCADGSGTYQLCSNLKAQFTGATNYTYNFTPTGMTGGSPVSFTGGGQLPLSTVALGLRYGGTYTVRIDANYNNLTFGNNQPDAPVTILGISICNITIAPHAQVFTKESNQCPATLLRGSIISGKPFVCAATSYTVEFTKVSDCVGTSIIGFPFEVNTSGASSNLNLSFSGPNQITNQSYYRVRWRPNFSYGAGDYGATNYIFIGGAVMENTEELLSEIVGSTKVETSMIEANLYPNPNNGEMVNLNMTDVNSSDVFVRIMDGMGRVVYSNRYVVDGSFNTLVTFAKPLSSGLYMVEFTSGDQIITERMIVER